MMQPSQELLMWLTSCVLSSRCFGLSRIELNGSNRWL